MSVTLLTQPDLPISVEDCRDYIRQSSTDDDAIIKRQIRSAVEWFQGYTSRCLMETQYSETFQGFCDPLVLSFAPLTTTAVTLTYIDIDGSPVTLPSDGSAYYVSAARGEITSPAGESWPQTLVGRPDSVTVEYNAGYGTKPEQMPPDMIDVILKRLHAIYDNRMGIPSDVDAACNMLAYPHRMMRLT